MIPPLLVFFKKVFDLCLGLFLMGMIMVKIIEYKSVASPLFTKLFRKHAQFDEETTSLMNSPSNSEEKAANSTLKQNINGFGRSLNYPLPLRCYFWKTSHDIISGTINCICCCPSFEAIQDLKEHPYFSHLPWVNLAYIDKRTFDILRHHLVTKTKENYGNTPQESQIFEADDSKLQNEIYQHHQMDIPIGKTAQRNETFSQYSDFAGYSEKEY